MVDIADVATINTVSSYSSFGSVPVGNIASINAGEVVEVGNDGYTRLLLHMDGDDDGTVFTDESWREYEITRVNAVTKTGQKQFGTAAGYFDGTGDYLTAPDSSDWDNSTDDMTWDCWINPTSLDNRAICGKGNTANFRETLLWIKTGGVLQWLIAQPDGAGIMSCESAPGVVSTGSWQHIAAVRTGTTFKIYVDGIVVATEVDVDPIPDTDRTFNVGVRNYKTTYESYFHGYIDEFRNSKGIARWTENFTPPTRAYGPQAFVPSGSPVGWWDASQLTGLSDDDPITTVTDFSASSNDLTQAAIDKKPLYKTNRKNGLPSIRFDGTDDVVNKVFTVTFPVTIFIVLKQITWTHGRYVFDGDTTASMIFLQNNPVNTNLINAGASLEAPVPAIGTWGLSTLRFDGASSFTRLNGAGQVNGNSGTGTTPAGLSLGAQGDEASRFCNIEIGEMIMYLGNESVAANEEGLMKKWGIA